MLVFIDVKLLLVLAICIGAIDVCMYILNRGWSNRWGKVLQPWQKNVIMNMLRMTLKSGPYLAHML